MTPAIVDTDQLKSITGYDRPGDIERLLRKNGVPFIHGRNGPFTTIDAINAALGIQSKPANEKSEFEFL